MVLEFNTTLDVSYPRTVTVPLTSSSAGVSVDWGGAGTANPGGSGSPTDQVQIYGASPGEVGCTYTAEGSYTVRICGSVQHYGNAQGWVGGKLVAVSSFGSVGPASLSGAFAGATHLTTVPASLPDAVTDISSMFFFATAFNQNVDSWDTSNVTDMSDMFSGAEAFDQNIGGWDTSKVTDMSGMFNQAGAFNQNIAGWDTSKVTDMRGMFGEAGAFNQNLAGWDTGRVTDSGGMFWGATAFNQNIGAWYTGNVTNMSGTFERAKAFNQKIGGWDTSDVTDMAGMFAGATTFNQNIGRWDTGKVTDMSDMFSGAPAFNQNIGGWKTGKVTDMSGMFAGATKFNQDIGGWSTGKVTDMSAMFKNAYSFNQYIGAWNTGNVTDMAYMFEGFFDAGPMVTFNQKIGSWDTSQVTDMTGMFRDAAFNQAIGGWNTSHVVDMTDMFQGARKFNQKIGAWNTSNVSAMTYMFNRAAAFNQNIGGWDTSHVTDMAGTFAGATKFNQKIGAWNTSAVTDMSDMFSGATAFNQSLSGWRTGNVSSMESMFSGATGFNQNLSSWNVTNLQNASRMFDRVSLSVANYDALLTGWAQQPVRDGTWFSGGLSKYSVVGQAGRNTLTGTHGWRITDGGLTVPTLSPTPTPTVDDRTPTVGQVLTAVAGVWGPAPVAQSYQWYRVNTHRKVSRIRGATHATYLVNSADAGYRLKATVTGSKPAYASTSRTSALTARVAKARFTTIPVPVVTVDATPRVGKVVTVTPRTYVPSQDRFSYQWYRGRSAIKGATKASYTLTAKDKGRQLKARVKAYRIGYWTTTSYGLLPGLVRAGLIANTPKLSDVTPVVGETILITPKTAIKVWGPQPVTAGYRWYRGSTPIGGATTGTYIVTTADLGKRLKVAVAGTKDDYATATRTSAASHRVAKGSFTMTGTPSIEPSGASLTVQEGIWMPIPDSFRYQWFRNGTAITAGTTRTWVATASGSYGVKVTATRNGYQNKTVTTAAVRLTL